MAIPYALMLSALVACEPEGPRQSVAGHDQATLEGIWVLIEQEESDGVVKPVNMPLHARTHLIVRGNRWSFNFPWDRPGYEFEAKLDSTLSPAQVDFYSCSRLFDRYVLFRTLVRVGIYEVDGDLLKLRIVKKDRARPSEFVTPAADNKGGRQVIYRRTTWEAVDRYPRPGWKISW
jgi:uncharacterized protein (TIGR03067 family)